MEITGVKITLRDEPKLKAFASITIDDCFVVTDLRVIEGTKGLFVAMPSRKLGNGSFKDIAHPLNNETREEIEKAVIDEYKKALKSTATKE
ncbi:MAG: septation regulator SpoVG [bacterium]|nr:septation regulator SpoVG [bacterium]